MGIDGWGGKKQSMGQNHDQDASKPPPFLPFSLPPTHPPSLLLTSAASTTAPMPFPSAVAAMPRELPFIPVTAQGLGTLSVFAPGEVIGQAPLSPSPPLGCGDLARPTTAVSTEPAAFTIPSPVRVDMETSGVKSSAVGKVVALNRSRWS